MYMHKTTTPMPSRFCVTMSKDGREAILCDGETGESWWLNFGGRCWERISGGPTNKEEENDGT